jgi:hypothetical protein
MLGRISAVPQCNQDGDREKGAAAIRRPGRSPARCYDCQLCVGPCILARRASFDVALFASEHRPKAVITVAWGNTPGARWIPSSSFGRRPYSPRHVPGDYGLRPMNRWHLRRSWGVAPGYGVSRPSANDRRDGRARNIRTSAGCHGLCQCPRALRPSGRAALAEPVAHTPAGLRPAARLPLAGLRRRPGARQSLRRRLMTVGVCFSMYQRFQRSMS